MYHDLVPLIYTLWPIDFVKIHVESRVKVDFSTEVMALNMKSFMVIVLDIIFKHVP